VLDQPSTRDLLIAHLLTQATFLWRVVVGERVTPLVSRR
jgi:hypothetical protein